MAERNNPDTRHITAHHIWAYLHADQEAEFGTAEHDHIVQCESCFRLFILCLGSESFGQVLKNLERSDESRCA